MKKFFALLALLAFSACTSKTEYGPCVGVLDEPDPALTYKADAGNIVLAIIFSETIIVPAIVIASELKCPVGQKATPK